MPNINRDWDLNLNLGRKGLGSVVRDIIHIRTSFMFDSISQKRCEFVSYLDASKYVGIYFNWE